MGGALESDERFVVLESPCQRLRTLIANAIVLETANKAKVRPLAAADSRKAAFSSVLERGEGLVRLEALTKVLCALCTDVVGRQTANRARMWVSAAADSRGKRAS